LNPLKLKKSEPEEQQISSASWQIADDLYRHLRGRSNLVFANSRGKTEQYAIKLSNLCEQQGVPNEFFPHHGSLGKHIRTELETRLQQEALPTTAVCTMTLEMGIDIGKVASVAQITTPPSVASLRQRLGRSGRRGDPAILRLYIDENELSKNFDPIDGLRLQNLQGLAMLHLLLGERWYEPPDSAQYHFSTLIHQILAVIAQWGAVQASQLWNLLCATGPFNRVTQDQFMTLLRHLGKQQIITQPASGELILGIQGERLTGHYSFYPAFQAPEEYRLVHAGKTLGTLPAYATTQADQCLVFAGKHWKVKEVDQAKKVITVVRSGGGEPAFAGDGFGMVHDRVRQMMDQCYRTGDHRLTLPSGQSVNLLDETAERLFQEGLRCYRELGLEERSLIRMEDTVYLIPWMGDKMVNTLTALLEHGGYTVSHRAGVIEIACQQEQQDVVDYLHSLDKDQVPENAKLAEAVPEKLKQTEKYDELLPEVLLNAGYGMKQFDVTQALEWLTKNQSRWASW
jgi:ATP-dependent Lhr-like helicase